MVKLRVANEGLPSSFRTYAEDEFDDFSRIVQKVVDAICLIMAVFDFMGSL